MVKRVTLETDIQHTINAIKITRDNPNLLKKRHFQKTTVSNMVPRH